MLIKQRSVGFTIVELLIVIVVIGILAAITIVAYTGVQARARNADRQADINAIVKALALYQIDNGSYPKQGTVVGMDIVDYPVTALKLPRNAIVSPTAPAGTLNSFNETKWAGDTSTDYYGYRALDTTGYACWDTTDTCMTYTLWYKLEGESSERTISGN
ncbi:MAG: ral secretion pathway protein [Candidatus Saccharibacteria bacterium]|jgi:prepilin-type N-terminal cleavage/methylation domain-containing protein|nr:ral secretion pathway protein [Candidatus Saccharibacteria bacterium]